MNVRGPHAATKSILRGTRSNRRKKSQYKGRFTRRKKFKLTGGKGTLRRDLIERGGSSEAWYGGGGRDRTADPRLMSPLLYLLSYTATHMVCTKGHPPRQGFSQRTGEP